MNPDAPIPARKRRIAMDCQLLTIPVRPAGIEYNIIEEMIVGFLPTRSAVDPIRKPPINIPNNQELRRSPVVSGDRFNSLERGLRTKDMSPEFMASNIQPRKHMDRIL
jgi:hypothetical protein